MIKLKKTEKTTVFVISAAVLMFAVPLLFTGCKQEPNNKESKPVAVTGVRLDETELSLVKGSKRKLSATVLPSSASNKNVSWTSDNPAVAEVDQNGNVTAKAPGSAVITVKTDDGGKTAACTVTVTSSAVAVTGVRLDNTELSLVKGSKRKLSATVLPSSASNKNISWTSDNPAVAEVDQNGNVTAKAPGSAVITVKTDDGGKTAACTVTVTSSAVAVTGVRLDNTELNLVKGSKGKLSATVLPSSASNKNVSWTSDNPAVAEVDQNGNVTAKAPGSAVITVKTDDGGKTAACTVTVTAKAEKNRAILTLGIKKDIKIKAVTGDGSAVTVEGCSETSLASGIEKVLQASGEKVILKGKITELYCNGNELQHINVKDLTGLTYLSCSSNNLTALDVQGLTALGTLNCLANKITSLNLQGLTALKALNCSSNILTSLDIQDLKALQILNCASNNLTDLDVQGLTSLKDIFCVENRITALNLQGLTDLQSIHCGRNRLVTLDAQNSAYLNILDCQDNQLTSLNVQNCPSLEQLNCFGNKLDKDAFKNLFEGMHNRKGINQGECVVYTEDGTENNYKGFTPDELKSVKDKNWKIIKITKDGNTDEL